jgi:hypothetical protein
MRNHKYPRPPVPFTFPQFTRPLFLNYSYSSNVPNLCPSRSIDIKKKFSSAKQKQFPWLVDYSQDRTYAEYIREVPVPGYFRFGSFT